MTNETSKKLLKKAELMDTLGIARTTLYRYEQKGLPFVQILGRKRYVLADVQRWLEEKANEPYPEGKIDGETVQELLSISRTTLHRLRKEGLPYEKMGKRILYDVRALENWLQQQKEHD